MRRENFWIVSLARVRLGRASREAEASGGHTDRVRQARVSMLSKELNKSNKIEKQFSHFDTNVRKLYFWGKSFCN